MYEVKSFKSSDLDNLKERIITALPSINEDVLTCTWQKSVYHVNI